MNRTWIVLLVVGTAACATADHTSHRVCIAPHKEVAPLVRQALDSADEAWPDSLKGYAFEIYFDNVDLRWVFFEESRDTEGVDLLEIEPYLSTAAKRWGVYANPDEAERKLELLVELDLHQPGELGMRVVCYGPELASGDPVLGSSERLVVPRLFCHGCRENAEGLGTQLVTESSSSGGGGGILLQDFVGGGGAGYIKR